MGHVIVVGAGIAGAACARALQDAGQSVTVVDRGRSVGGRMAIRSYEGRPVDIGASYFTVAEPAFRKVVDGWEERGLARPWTDTFAVLSDDGERTSTGPMRWAAPSGLRGLVEDLADGLDVRRETVAMVDRPDGALTVDGVAADGVVLAMPDPQAARLLGAGLAAEKARLDAAFDPVLALTAGWAQRSWPDRDGVFVNGNDTLAWVADDGLRRGDRAPVLVAHSTAGFAGQHLDAPEQASGAMVSALRELLDITEEPDLAAVHRWTFAKPAGRRSEPYLLSDNGFGVCGDGWSEKPRVEAAYLSGHALGEALAAQLSPGGA